MAYTIKIPCQYGGQFKYGGKFAGSGGGSHEYSNCSGIDGTLIGRYDDDGASTLASAQCAVLNDNGVDYIAIMNYTTNINHGEVLPYGDGIIKFYKLYLTITVRCFVANNPTTCWEYNSGELQYSDYVACSYVPDADGHYNGLWKELASDPFLVASTNGFHVVFVTRWTHSVSNAFTLYGNACSREAVNFTNISLTLNGEASTTTTALSTYVTGYGNYPNDPYDDYCRPYLAESGTESHISSWDTKPDVSNIYGPFYNVNSENLIYIATVGLGQLYPAITGYLSAIVASAFITFNPISNSISSNATINFPHNDSYAGYSNLYRVVFSTTPSSDYPVVCYNNISIQTFSYIVYTGTDPLSPGAITLDGDLRAVNINSPSTFLYKLGGKPQIIVPSTVDGEDDKVIYDNPSKTSYFKIANLSTGVDDDGELAYQSGTIIGHYMHSTGHIVQLNSNNPTKKLISEPSVIDPTTTDRNWEIQYDSANWMVGRMPGAQASDLIFTQPYRELDEVSGKYNIFIKGITRLGSTLFTMLLFQSDSVAVIRTLGCTDNYLIISCAPYSGGSPTGYRILVIGRTEHTGNFWVESTDPADGDTNEPVLERQVIKVTFNKEVDKTTVEPGNLDVYDEGGLDVEYEVALVDDVDLYLLTLYPYHYNATYTCYARVGLQDTDDEPLEEEYPWSFSTEAGDTPWPYVNTDPNSPGGYTSSFAGLTGNKYMVIHYHPISSPDPIKPAFGLENQEWI